MQIFISHFKAKPRLIKIVYWYTKLTSKISLYSSFCFGKSHMYSCKETWHYTVLSVPKTHPLFGKLGAKSIQS